jgi:hypothetical protein
MATHGERLDPLNQAPPKPAFFEQLPDSTTVVAAADLPTSSRRIPGRGFRGGLNWYRNMDRTWVSGPFQGKRSSSRHLHQRRSGSDPDEPGLRRRCARLYRTCKTSLLPGIGHWTQQKPDAVSRVDQIPGNL